MHLAFLVLAAPAAWSAPDLALTGSCPGQLNINVTAGATDGKVFLVGSTTAGASSVPVGPCAGTPLEIAPPYSVFGPFPLDATGATQLTPTAAGPGPCGMLLQAVDTACETSGLVNLAGICPDADLDGVCDAWVLEGDFLLHPDQANPQADGFGNDGVWSYLFASRADLGAPERATLLDNYTIVDTDHGQWDSPYEPFSVPFIGLGNPLAAGSGSLHPGAEGSARELVIVRWTAPIADAMRVEFNLTDVDGACGDGLEYWIYRGSDLQTNGLVVNGGGSGGGLVTTVEVGDTIDLVVGPNASFSCDTTRVSLSIAPN